MKIQCLTLGSSGRKKARDGHVCQTSGDIHPMISADRETLLDNDLEDHEYHFYAALEQQLNLSPVFIKFVKTAGPLSASMPLLLHNWEEIIQIWIVALDESDEEGLAVLECVLDRYFARKTVLTQNYSLLQKNNNDLRMTL
ncbi:hypothetical protein B0H14DRAFT_3134509 [Mycena olivaceomarginata]|nr:hypothetical protein B0H14DRAFT_3134509 [Mycena olivaceomarginata]